MAERTSDHKEETQKTSLPVPPELLWGLAAANNVFIEDGAWEGMTDEEMIQDAIRRVGEHLKDFPEDSAFEQNTHKA